MVRTRDLRCVQKFAKCSRPSVHVTHSRSRVACHVGLLHAHLVVVTVVAKQCISILLCSMSACPAKLGLCRPFSAAVLDTYHA